MHSALLRRWAFPLAIFNEAAVLPKKSQKKRSTGWKTENKTYSLLPPIPLRSRQRIMVLLDMQIQEPTRGKIPPTLNTPIHMSLTIMNLIIRIRGKRERLPMRRQWTTHHLDSGIGRALKMGDLGRRCCCWGWCWRGGSWWLVGLKWRVAEWGGTRETARSFGHGFSMFISFFLDDVFGLLGGWSDRSVSLGCLRYGCSMYVQQKPRELMITLLAM